MTALAARGLYLGTSSWKYPGWRGQLYTEDRYLWHGRFSQSRFERLCLAEYAEVFKTVCVDAAYYKFPEPATLQELVSQVPADFLFTFKVTDQITIKRFARLPRFGAQAGQRNPDFLNHELFAKAFLEPCAPFQKNIGLLIFEFSHFAPEDFDRGRDFVAALDGFLGHLPSGWRYGVEVRNRSWLHPDYFATLTRHGVTHIFNSWDGMPPVAEQWALPGSRTASGFFGARLLLRPGRKYADAVQRFKPYNQIGDPYPEGQAAGARLIREQHQSGDKTKGFIYVNNRFEGNALQTIAAIVDRARREA